MGPFACGGPTAALALSGHRGGARTVAIGHAGDMLPSGGDDGTVRVWHTATGELQAVLEGHTAAVYSLALSADGRVLCSAGFDRTVRIWDAQTGRDRGALNRHTDAVYAVALSASGEQLASCSLDGTVRLWDLTSGPTLVRTLQPDRRYERMDTTGLQGITPAQRDTLLALGAAERPTA
jgi:WD40 repeat protein